MLRPPRLMPGDRIALVAPASGFDRVGFDRGVQEVRRLGFEPVYTEAVFERAFFTAGAPEPRAVDFTRAWEDPSVAALLAIRGGYGSMQILPLLDRLRPAARPKLFIGYSDVTAILTWLTCHHEVAAIHGPMIEGRLAEGTERYDELSFASLLRGDAGFELAPAGLDVLRPGEVRGPMFGGTITQLTASLGTPFAFAPPDECVLFLEDVNERPYRLHRLLTHLRLGGVLARARALVFGEMTGCDEPGGVTAMDVIRDVTQGFAGPVLVGFPSGHTTGACWSLPFGVAVTVTTHPRPAVVVEESAVE